MGSRAASGAGLSMADKEPYLDFRFTIAQLPEGRALTAEEIEAMMLREIEQTGGTSKQALWNLVLLYSRTGRHDQALERLKTFLSMTTDREERASCLIAMGQLHEWFRDYDRAIGYYREAFAIEPEHTASRYLINNNLGYCLIQIGQFKVAEAHLEAAITIDPKRANAFKNLGLALQHQGKNGEAADCFVLATQANAADSRSLKHLEKLVAKHPELLLVVPGLAGKLEACLRAVAYAASRQPDVDACWEEVRMKQTKLS